jgi:hypothetical protein
MPGDLDTPPCAAVKCAKLPGMIGRQQGKRILRENA